MFVIRQAVSEDHTTLLRLARTVHFLNLPADPALILEKISRSRRSFAGHQEDEREREFMFVLEDTETGNVIGTSTAKSCISWEEHPHIFLNVCKREHYSQDLQTGAVHLVLQLGTDTSGPSELGGLILAAAYRGRKERLGALLSLIRLHFIGLQRESFADRIIAQMMPPLTPYSSNSLWEYLGGRFINLSYIEADSFNQHSKEFILSLFPKSEIYASLLPPEARNLIGRVGPETKGAKALLERLGFRENNHIDPFDGGPHLEAKVDDISIVRETITLTLGDSVDKYPNDGFVSAWSDSGFRAAQSNYAARGDQIFLPAETVELIEAQPGDAIGLTPLRIREDDEESARRSKKKSANNNKNNSNGKVDAKTSRKKKKKQQQVRP